MKPLKLNDLKEIVKSHDIAVKNKSRPDMPIDNLKGKPLPGGPLNITKGKQ